MTEEQRRYFRDELRDARAEALANAEDFDALLFVIERLGGHLLRRVGTLRAYKCVLCVLASRSPLSAGTEWHTRFDDLCDLVREARNDALHQGAFARHLAQHAIEMALVLEDALMCDLRTVDNYMVRVVAQALPWQPLSFVRQMMLSNAFSYLPLYEPTTNRWLLVTDLALARQLRSVDATRRE